MPRARPGDLLYAAARRRKIRVQGNVVVACARRVLFWVAIVVASLASVPALAADPKLQREALALQKKAIEEDSLNVDYVSAVKKLQSAAAKCDGDRCTPAIKGAILRDLGAMQILAGSEDDGRASFAQALAVDGQLELDPAYKNPQLEGVWEDVKKKGSAAASEPPASAGSQPSGDFAHTPAPEAPVRTPLPVFVEYSSDEAIARVIAKYKGAGMTDWKLVELTKRGTGYGGLIPCKDVTQGTMSYYVQGFNAANDPVATAGSRNKPYTVPVKAEITGPAPAFPGEDAPKQCSELAVAECPPDFPGCNNPKKGSGEDCDNNKECTSNSCVGGKCAEKKAGGEDCEKDDECTSASCADGKCSEAKKAAGQECDGDDDCDSDSCSDGKCSAAGGGKFPRIWVGLNVSLDLDVMKGASDACSQTSGSINTAGYRCVDGSGALFPATQAENGNIVIGRSDQVQGGVTHGPFTILASFDYALSQNLLVGARAGYELLTIPTGAAFAPVHLEARLTYLFGKDALTSRLAPLALVGLGVGEFDAFVPVTAYSQPTAKDPQATPHSFNAWLTAGPVFATAGGGLRYLVKKRIAATLAIKLQGAFGGYAGFLFGVVPELGVQVGF
jgi:hypothetical protein